MGSTETLVVAYFIPYVKIHVFVYIAVLAHLDHKLLLSSFIKQMTPMYRMGVLPTTMKRLNLGAWPSL